MKIGDKVVCINDENQYNISIINYTDYIVKNEIYKIKGFDELGGLILFGVNSGTFRDLNPAGFMRSRFRKLDYDFADNVLENIKEKLKEDYILN